ncbi:hypothetical protein MPLB_1680085 [Mesorhizobium sp. ORS 3324]|nr:hypothetical protein MPLB_1680085 [Mesorhizobium sp. ORS 3324]
MSAASMASRQRPSTSSRRRDGGVRPRRLKALEDENARLKKLLVEEMLDDAILKDVAAKKW